METVVERPGALDVHKAQVTACVRVPAAHGSAREHHVVEFSTTVSGLLRREPDVDHGDELAFGGCAYAQLTHSE
jgi:hypothetical protein